MKEEGKGRKKEKGKEIEKTGLNLSISYFTIAKGVKRRKKIVECFLFTLLKVEFKIFYLESYFFISELL